MAQKRQKDLLNRLADAGEEAFSRVAGSPATSRLVESVGGMRERLDEVQKKLRGLDALEERVARIEQRLDEAEKPKPRSSAGTSRSRTSSAKKTAPASTKSSGPATSRRSGTRKKPAS